MTRDDIIRMAQEAGWEMDTKWDMYDGFMSRLERFANLVAAAERSACAQVCDDWPNGRDDVYLIGKAIRARGEK